MVLTRHVSVLAAAAAALPLATWAEAPLVTVPAGAFTMGRAVGGSDDERPPHHVTVRAFQLEATLVTVADFRAFVAATHHRTTAERLGFGMVGVEGLGEWQWKKVEGASWLDPFLGLPVEDDWPVTLVSWADAAAYCAWKGRRLPTEAEWEYAMRAGATTRFPWGDRPTLPDGGLGLNHWQGPHRKSARKDPYLYVSPVRAFPPNAWGLYDPVGNVWQLTADWYAKDAFAQAGDPAVDPQGPPTGTLRVARGGSWWCSKDTCAAYGLSTRGKTSPDAPFNNAGFRCARDLPR